MNEKTFAPGEFIGCIGWKMEGELSIEFRDTRGEYVGAPFIPCPVGTRDPHVRLRGLPGPTKNYPPLRLACRLYQPLTYPQSFSSGIFDNTVRISPAQYATSETCDLQDSNANLLSPLRTFRNCGNRGHSFAGVRPESRSRAKADVKWNTGRQKR